VLEGIFGNRTAEKALLHVYHYGEVHASGIAKDYQMALNPVLKQLDRFERSGVIVSKKIGRSRLYFFNRKSPIFEPIRLLLKITYESIPLKEREIIFASRRRPRKNGKQE
jgi:hypothetical protein